MAGRAPCRGQGPRSCASSSPTAPSSGAPRPSSRPWLPRHPKQSRLRPPRWQAHHRLLGGVRREGTSCVGPACSGWSQGKLDSTQGERVTLAHAPLTVGCGVLEDDDVGVDEAATRGEAAGGVCAAPCATCASSQAMWPSAARGPTAGATPTQNDANRDSHLRLFPASSSRHPASS
jgi:hypothetical protein